MLSIASPAHEWPVLLVRYSLMLFLQLLRASQMQVQATFEAVPLDLGPALALA